jgi:potassium/chloride transporter 4/5/6
LARDGVIPFLSFFKVTHREEPRRALLLTFLIACAGVLIGNLDAVAPITTMLYLICYAFLNASTALLSLLHYPKYVIWMNCHDKDKKLFHGCTSLGLMAKRNN